MKITFRKPADQRALSLIAPLTVVKVNGGVRTDRLLVTNDSTADTIACVDLRSGVIHQVERTQLVEILESELVIKDEQDAAVTFIDKW
jgi:hypothetical protein